jgi:hypothetical protein
MSENNRASFKQIEKRGLSMKKKAILVASIALLFISISLQPVSAQMTSTQNIELQEVTVIEKFMDEIERIASESQTSCDFIEHLQDLCLNVEYRNCTIVREFISKILQFLIKERGISIGGININDLLGNFSSKFRPDYFVISYGVYNRLNPLKGNSIDLFKGRLSMWRYAGTSNLLKGRTLILERHPFGIHQKMIGPQLGFMKGFKGIYLDIESKLTGNAYVMFMGRVDRIRAFELTPLSK